MHDLVEQKFKEWTKGLSGIAARISIFEKIRDIPYHIDAELFDLGTGPVRMLEENVGTCTPKHNLLGAMFERLGLRVKYCSYPFHWKDTNITYGKELQEQIKTLPVTYHLACKVLINDKWVLVDATWDKGLLGSGIPVNTDWDGLSNTILAVKLLEEFDYSDAETRDRAVTRKMDEYHLSEKLALSRFSLEFNKWIEQIRR